MRKVGNDLTKNKEEGSVGMSHDKSAKYPKNNSNYYRYSHYKNKDRGSFWIRTPGTTSQVLTKKKKKRKRANRHQQDSNQVSEFLNLNKTLKNFIAGKISHFYEKWTKLTKDRFILDIVKHGYEIEFTSDPCDECNRMPINFNPIEKDTIFKLLRV